MVYVTVRCPSVSATPTAQADAATCGGFAAVGPTGGQEIDQLLHGRSAPSSNGAAAARRTAAQQHGRQKQMRAVSRLQPP